MNNTSGKKFKQERNAAYEALPKLIEQLKLSNQQRQAAIVTMLVIYIENGGRLICSKESHDRAQAIIAAKGLPLPTIGGGGVSEDPFFVDFPHSLLHSVDPYDDNEHKLTIALRNAERELKRAYELCCLLGYRRAAGKARHLQQQTKTAREERATENPTIGFAPEFAPGEIQIVVMPDPEPDQQEVPGDGCNPE
jgi:hypothetical protein